MSTDISAACHWQATSAAVAARRWPSWRRMPGDRSSDRPTAHEPGARRRPFGGTRGAVRCFRRRRDGARHPQGRVLRRGTRRLRVERQRGYLDTAGPRGRLSREARPAGTGTGLLGERGRDLPRRIRRSLLPDCRLRAHVDAGLAVDPATGRWRVSSPADLLLAHLEHRPCPVRLGPLRQERW